MPTGEYGQEGRFRNMLMEHRGLAVEKGTGTASSAAVTVDEYIGQITTESLTTAQNAIATVTLTNNKVAAGDLVFWSVQNGSNTQGTPMPGWIVVTANTVVFKVINKHASSEAFNGTIKINFMVVKAL